MTRHGDRFSGLVRVENQEDGIRDVLLDPLCYTTADGQWRLCVPAGFVTDYASIPRPLWAVLPPRGRYNRAAIIHDYLYHQAPLDPRTEQRCTWTTADAVLREACGNLDVRWTQRMTLWAGVRVGGWVAWRRYRTAEAETI